MRPYAPILHPFLLILAAAEPTCENLPHPLPAVDSCLKLINTIHNIALLQPYLYHWSRHPSNTEHNARRLPRHWTDPARRGPSPYTYFCTITVDVMEGHEEDGADSFGFNEVADTAMEIVQGCLKRERGLRPQVGWDGVGFLQEPQVVRVRVGSVRGVDILRVGGNRRGEGLDI
ncbi:MAG: hypothetical protein Q9182_000881 [Xanthomendoza sp. 2 TL-2023]